MVSNIKKIPSSQKAFLELSSLIRAEKNQWKGREVSLNKELHTGVDSATAEIFSRKDPQKNF